jgi:integrase
MRTFRNHVIFLSRGVDIMGRPATPVGTYGVINVEKLPPTRAGKVRHRASTYFRMADGTLRLVRRQAPTKGQATTRLKEALRELTDETRDGDISKDTRFCHVAELWLEEIAQEAELGNLSPTTVSLYRRALKNWALPSLGQLQCREVLVTRCDKVVKKARFKTSYDTAKTVKAALSGACDYAVRHGAMDANPVRSVGRMSRGKQKEVLTLSGAQRVDLLAKLRAYAPTRQIDARGRSLGARGRIWQDLPDLMEAMLSSGARIGEVLAILGPDVEPAAPTVAVTHHVVRVPGAGLERCELRKGERRRSAARGAAVVGAHVATTQRCRRRRHPVRLVHRRTPRPLERDQPPDRGSDRGRLRVGDQPRV